MVPRHKGPGKNGAALQEHPALKLRTQRDKMLPAVPTDVANPVEWADKHLESLAPEAAREVEWALKFGSDTARYVAARDVLATKGITTKPKDTGPTQQAMVFNFTGPVSPSGAPVLPFSNAQTVIAAPVIPPQLTTAIQGTDPREGYQAPQPLLDKNAAAPTLQLQVPDDETEDAP